MSEFVMTKTNGFRPAKSFYFIPQIIALLVAGPILWAAFDRTPPLRLHHGAIEPPTVPRGGTVSVVWLANYSGRDCPGYSQREIIDSESDLWPKLTRERRGVYRPSADNPRVGVVTTPPLTIPSQISAGEAQYRVTQFYYCNWLQKLLAWPIVEKSPPIYFEVKP